MHFTKYTNQENYQDTKYKQVYTNTLEKETVVIDYIHIYIINKTYTVSVIKTLYKKEKENVKKHNLQQSTHRLDTIYHANSWI